MDRDQANNWAIAAVAAIYAAGVGALTATVWKAWLALSLACAAFLAFLGFLCWLRRLQPRPHVGAPQYAMTGVPVIEFTLQNGVADRHVAGYELVPMSYLYVWNNPRHGSASIESAHVIMRFTPANRSPLEPLFARWSHLPKGISIEETTAPRRIEIFANEPLYARFDVGFRSDTGDLYAMNDASGFLNGGYMDETRWLGRGPVGLDVNLRGRSARRQIDEHFRFVIHSSDEPAGILIDGPIADEGKSRRFRIRVANRVGSLAHSVGRGIHGFAALALAICAAIAMGVGLLAASGSTTSG